MASPPFDIAQTLPGDSDIASQFPALERTYRDIVESWLLVNHNTLGQHKYVEFMDQASDPTFASGIVGLWNNGGVLRTRLSSGAAARIEAFPIGTGLLFIQATLPPGWTLDTSYLDRVIRVNSTAGNVGGNWTLAGAQVDTHVLTVAEMPSHQHDVWLPKPGSEGTVNNVGGYGGGAVNLNPTTNGSGPTGGNLPHGHNISNPGGWRPAYVDAMFGVKNSG